MEKIHKMVTKCIEILDPKVKVIFRNNACGLAIRRQRKIILPDWQEDLFELLMSGFHELAHILFSTEISASKLSDEQRIALRFIEEVYVNYRFCEHYPELRNAFNQRYYNYQQESENNGVIGDYNFWSDFEYTLWDIWDIGIRHGVTPLCKELLEKGLIEKLQKIVHSAKSTKQLVPAARKLVIEIQKNKQICFPTRGMRHPLEIEKFDIT